MADLAAHGHRTAWWLAPPSGWWSGGASPRRARRRLRARARHRARDAPPSARRWTPTAASREARQSACARGALVAYCDLAAVRLLRACAGAGVRIPDELSVVGFDAVESQHAVPQLGSIDHRYAELGQAAVGSSSRCSPRRRTIDGCRASAVVTATALARAWRARAASSNSRGPRSAMPRDQELALGAGFTPSARLTSVRACSESSPCTSAAALLRPDGWAMSVATACAQSLASRL